MAWWAMAREEGRRRDGCALRPCWRVLEWGMRGARVLRGGICAYVRSRSEVDQPVGAAVGPARCFAGEGTNCCKGQALNTEWPIEKYPRVLDGIVHGKEP